MDVHEIEGDVQAAKNRIADLEAHIAELVGDDPILKNFEESIDKRDLRIAELRAECERLRTIAPSLCMGFRRHIQTLADLIAGKEVCLDATESLEWHWIEAIDAVRALKAECEKLRGELNVAHTHVYRPVCKMGDVLGTLAHYGYDLKTDTLDADCIPCETRPRPGELFFCTCGEVIWDQTETTR